VSARAFPVVLAGLLVLTLAFLTIPVAAIFLEAGPAKLWDALGNESSLDALRLSLICSGVALALIVLIGTPVAYLLATRRFRGRSVAITLIELPLVLPPAVAGLGLLVAFGPDGFIGGLIEDAGVQLVFETVGVIVALTFVASPFYLRQAQAAFEALEPSWLEAARTLGDSEATALMRVAVPAAAPGLITGGALAWGRALGEFGATLVFAGSFQGITQTAPLAIVELYGTDLSGALALSAVLVGFSAALLAAVKLASGGRGFGLVVD
jgi:molybdate transport system permease protein